MGLGQWGPKAKKDCVAKDLFAYIPFPIWFPFADPISCSVECVPCSNYECDSGSLHTSSSSTSESDIAFK